MSVFAIDCDGTLFKWAKFPELGDEVPYAIGTVKRLIASGHAVYIWTCRGGEAIDPVKKRLKELGVKYSGINLRRSHHTYPSQKIIADWYIDDKAIGCPLIPQANGEPYVDWLAIEIFLRRQGLFTIQLGAGD
jgi:hydroxymethylpyrimidine pyrophosphatase-like HAD family hydrolase